MERAIRINEIDNVAVALESLLVGDEVCIGGVRILIMDNIKAGHKLALRDISEGESIIKYGAPIGYATQRISVGQWVHEHNVRTGLTDTIDYQYEAIAKPLEGVKRNRLDRADGGIQQDTFLGYVREDGTVGIRNELWVIPTVGCVNGIANRLATLTESCRIEGVDRVVAYSHPYGCSQMGEDQETTRRLLADLVHHPNCAGVLVVGLGCENSNIGVMRSYIGDVPPERVKYLECQGVEDEIEEGQKLLSELMTYAARFVRSEVPVSKLTIGLKCGGSDGFSGITANPVVGRVADLLIDKGGSAILTEVPEMFGAETLLMNRCVDKTVFDKTVKLITDFKDYFLSNHQTVYENPSPGNRAGGITTLEDKALGCTQKSGTSKVKDVLAYSERTKCTGLNLLSAPGNDLVAATALAAAGAQIVLFTTGRGTPFSTAVPTVKISSNSELATRKRNWIDYDAGRVLYGKTMDEASEELYRLILQVANGKQVVSEEAGYREIAIFKNGVTL